MDKEIEQFPAFPACVMNMVLCTNHLLHVMLHTPPIHMYFVLRYKLVYNYKTRSKSAKWSTNNRKLYGKTKFQAEQLMLIERAE